MQDAQQPSFQVIQAAQLIFQLAPMISIQAQGQGIDGEIAADQVISQRAGLHGRQSGGVLVGFRTGGNEIEAMLGGVRWEPAGCPKTKMGGYPTTVMASQRPGEGNGIALDNQIKICRRVAQK